MCSRGPDRVRSNEARGSRTEGKKNSPPGSISIGSDRVLISSSELPRHTVYLQTVVHGIDCSDRPGEGMLRFISTEVRREV